jgi:cyanophycin synthetase
VIVDYAHNPHSVTAFKEFMKNISEHKTGIVTGVGDRRDEDIKEIGRLAAEMYDKVIIRIDRDTRGRDPKQIAALITRGVADTDPHIPCITIPEEEEALRQALKESPEGGYIVLNAEYVKQTLEMVKKVKASMTG